MEFVPKSVHWLLPEEPSPCDILLYFRGQYAVAVPSGAPTNFKILEKLAKTQCTQIYIRGKDLEAWNIWTAQRHPTPQTKASEATKKDEETTQKILYGNKRAELLSFVQKGVQKRIEGNAPLDQAFEKALAVIQKVIRQPTLDWYFQQFHEPPDLFHHNGRVAFSLAIFCSLRKIVHEEELETLVYSALIHELEGNPAENVKTVVSQQTLALFEKRKDPVPKDVIKLIEMHDEFCSGRGFPNNKKKADLPVSIRVFTLFNHFDQYRLLNTGTRRARFDRAKQTMETRLADYDQDIWPLFWEFWEKQAESVS